MVHAPARAEFTSLLEPSARKRKQLCRFLNLCEVIQPLDDRLDQSADRGVTRQATPNQAAVDQHAPESLVEARLGRHRMQPEGVEVLLVRETWKVVNRIAQG